jgi:hypothetical protein
VPPCAPHPRDRPTSSRDPGGWGVLWRAARSMPLAAVLLVGSIADAPAQPGPPSIPTGDPGLRALGQPGQVRPPLPEFEPREEDREGAVREAPGLRPPASEGAGPPAQGLPASQER